MLSTFITSHCLLTMWCIWLGYQFEKAFSTPESKLNGLKVIKDWKKLKCLATTFKQKGKTHKQITKNQPLQGKAHLHTQMSIVLHICNFSAWESRAKRTILSYTVARNTQLHREKSPQKSDPNKKQNEKFYSPKLISYWNKSRQNQNSWPLTEMVDILCLANLILLWWTVFI